ncbi:MAG: CRISPR-associated protein Cas4 [Rubrobacteraceae bacterium]
MSDPPEWEEAEVVMISALQHHSYCPRQCALIHVEKVFDENIYTLRGHRVHERAHESEGSLEDGVRIERGLSLFSDRLGLIGKSDVVEFRTGEPPYPVEYKSGPRRGSIHDDIQLCAQAICLEEMLGCSVPRGAVYHYASRRRREVVFDEELRSLTEKTVRAVRHLLSTSSVPPPVADARCPKCSLFDACMPFALAGAEREAAWIYDLRK